MQQVNRNVRFVYNQILKQFNRLEVLSSNRFQVTLNTDPRACYVALNMKELLPDADPGFSLDTSDIEVLSKEIVGYLIHPLCALFKLPVTERASIGFPLISINCVQDSLRITIGLESEHQLRCYIEILAYVSFVLNRQRDPKLFLNPERRRQYFGEKVNQFHAMTPGMDFEYKTIFSAEGRENSYQERGYTHNNRQLKRVLYMKNGRCALLREVIVNNGNNTSWKKYAETQIRVHIREIGDVSLSNPRLSIAERRMVVACLTQQMHPEEINHQNVHLSFDNGCHTVTFVSMEMPGLWNMGCAYGPFRDGTRFISFYLYQKQIYLEVNGRIFPESRIIVKQGSMKIPLINMPIADREFLIREGFYEVNGRPRNFPVPTHLGLLYNPKGNYVHFSIEEGNLHIERDFICCQKQGATVYKRYLGENITCYEIDFWREKDPSFARFMRLMAAIFVKKTMDVNFKARNFGYSHFIFNLSYDKADIAFSQALEQIIAQKKALFALLIKHRNNASLQQYPFVTDSPHTSNLSWPSGYASLDHAKNRPLIEESIGLLLRTPTVILNTTSSSSSSTHLPDNVEQCQASVSSKQIDTDVSAGAALVYLQKIHANAGSQTSAASPEEKQPRVLRGRTKLAFKANTGSGF